MLVGVIVCIGVVTFEQSFFETLNVRLVRAELKRKYIAPGELTDPVMRALVKDPREPNIEPTWANAFTAAWESKTYQRLPNAWWAWSSVAMLWGMHSVFRIAVQSQKPVRRITSGTALVCLVLLMPAFAETALRAVQVKTYNTRSGGVHHR